MDLNNVILTLKELDELDEQFKKLPIKGGLDRAWQNWVDFKNKAQCLKLLNFMKQPCNDHEYFFSSKWLCGECNRDIRKLLKEQND